MKPLMWGAAWSICLVVVTVASAQVVPGPFSFSDPTVRLPTGVVGWSAEITLKSTTPQDSVPQLADFDPVHPSLAAVKFEPVSSSTPESNIWRYIVRVSGLPPMPGQQRFAQVTYGTPAKTQTLAYMLTSGTPNFSWVLSKVGEPWVQSSFWWKAACTQLNVTPKDSPASGINAYSTMVEQTTKATINSTDLKVCRVEGAECGDGQSLTVPANVTSVVRVCMTEGIHGNYRGALVLTSAQKPEGDVILQSASFSSGIAKVFGFLCICVGVYLAWWAKIWARSRIERNQALVPAALLASQLVTLQGKLASLPAQNRPAQFQLNTRLSQAIQDLSEDVLDIKGFLPPKIPMAFGYTVDSGAYKAYLEKANAQYIYYMVLVTAGIIQAQSEDNGTLQVAEQTLVKNAIAAIDAMSTVTPVPAQADALKSVQAVTSGLHNTLHPPPAGAPPAAATQAAAQSQGLQSLLFETSAINTRIWIVYGVLTALTGLAVLILSNPGYGVPLDFLFALFWGFGLPTTITSLAPSSAASALNISIPKG